MNLLPKSHQEFSQKEYWDSFFKQRGGRAFEWYGEYPELSSYLHKYLKQTDEILITGCGNSTLGRDLYDIGYRKITNIDISQVVIRQMISQNEKERPSLRYMQMDALSTSFENDSFNVVLDKGTLDALMPDATPEINAKILKYFKEIERVLKLMGRYVCISLLQEHILRAILDYFPSNSWMFRLVRCFEAESKALQKGENSMPVFLVICTKFKSLSQEILELNLTSGEKMQRIKSAGEVQARVKDVQEAAFVCSGLRNCSLQESEISLDLFSQGEAKPRFTVYVVDAKHEARNTQYAAFIVPQGREAEWLFATKPGRKHLVSLSKANRLAIVTMQRGQIYGTFEQVQQELHEVVCNLAPQTLKSKKIPFLSLGSDVGNRVVKFEGSSSFSGDYVVEDVEIDGTKFRRLFYLSSQLVIQSEAKLKTNKAKEVVDLTYLTCQHHIYMSMASHLACQGGGGKIAVLGLGGGGLCSFLHKFLPEVEIVGVDIDEDMLKIATNWFGLRQNNRLKVIIQDGVEFLHEVSTKNEQFSAVLFDLDSKDSSIGMSCPPKQFIDDRVIKNVLRIIGGRGFFILNLVIRDPTLRPPVINNLKNSFHSVISYRLAEDLNEILICTDQKLPQADIKDLLCKSLSAITKFFKKNRPNDDSDLDENVFVKTLQIL